MEHNEVKKKITAFIDGEINEDEKGQILSHIGQCAECKEEHETLLKNDLYLQNGAELEPSVYFNAKLDKKIEAEGDRKPVFWLERLIPVPIVMALLVLLISGMLVTAPVLYAANNSNIKAQVKEMAVKIFACCVTGSVFAPAAFAKFCDTCNMNICSCCAMMNGQKCPMGGNENGK